MKFKLWLYNSDGCTTIAVEDTSIQVYRSGAWMLRDQSDYEGNKGNFVWRPATFPDAVRDAVMKGKGICIAESDWLSAFNANISHALIQHIHLTGNIENG